MTVNKYNSQYMKKLFFEKRFSLFFWAVLFLQVIWLVYHCFANYNWEFQNELNLLERLIDTFTSIYTKYYVFFLPLILLTLDNKYTETNDSLILVRTGRVTLYYSRLFFGLVFATIWCITLSILAVLLHALCTGSISAGWSEIALKGEEYVVVAYPFTLLSQVYPLTVTLILSWLFFLLETYLFVVINYFIHTICRRNTIATFLIVLFWISMVMGGSISVYFSLGSYTNVIALQMLGIPTWIAAPLIIVCLVFIIYFGLYRFLKQDLLGSQNV